MGIFERREGDTTSWARGTRAVTVLQVALLAVAAVLAGFFAVSAMPHTSARAQGAPPPVGQDVPGGGPRGRFGGPGFREEVKVLARFDKDGNKRLDATERAEARSWLNEQGMTGRGFGRGGFGRGPGGRGGPGGRFAEASPGRSLSPADVTSQPGAPLYAPDVLRTMFIQFESRDWEQELADFHNTDVDVPATVIVDGKTYKDVGVRFRGMSSYMMVPAGLKRSLNLSFDFAHDKQDLEGYNTINLLNANGDPTFVRGVLFSQIARAYLPAPKMNYMRVAINGESWGVYLNAQQFNKDFLRENYDSDKGTRWKVPGSPNGRGGMEYLGDDPAAYRRIYEIKSKDDPRAWTALIALFKTLNETPIDQLEARLAPMLDIDGALRFLAVDIALVNSDGFWTRASDYNLYLDESGRFHVIPHDMNEALMDEGGGRGFGPPGGFGRGPSGPATSLDPLFGLDDTSKPLRSRLLSVPSLRARYMTYVGDIATNWLSWDRLGPIVKERQALIADEVTRDTRKLYSTEAFTADVTEGENSLKTFIEERGAYLRSRTAAKGN